MKTGIYKIKNDNNNKIYIGSSFDIEGRFLHHKYAMKAGTHFNKHIQFDFNKGDSFSFEVIKECDSKDLSKEEKKTIDSFKKSEIYNINTGVIKRKSKPIDSINSDKKYCLLNFKVEEEVKDDLKKIAKKELSSNNMTAALLFLINRHKRK